MFHQHRTFWFTNITSGFATKRKSFIIFYSEINRWIDRYLTVKINLHKWKVSLLAAAASLDGENICRVYCIANFIFESIVGATRQADTKTSFVSPGEGGGGSGVVGKPECKTHKLAVYA